MLRTKRGGKCGVGQLVMTRPTALCVVARPDPSMGGPNGGSGSYAIRALSWNNLHLEDVDRYHRQMALIQALVAERPVAPPPGKGSAIMASEFAHLTQADQHIAGAKERIVRQQQLIERIGAGATV